jgi:hypothetical protein
VGRVLGNQAVILERDFQRARIWLGALPNVEYRVDEVVRKSLSASAQGLRAERHAAVEVVRPTGGRILYGLVGGSFRPTLVPGDLAVEVAIAQGELESMVDDFAPTGERVKVGLPTIYGESVMAGALSAADIQAFGPGSVRFDHAAYGVFGSAPVVFSWLAHADIRLLARGDRFERDADLARFIFEGQPGIGGI